MYVVCLLVTNRYDLDNALRRLLWRKRLQRGL